MQPDAAGVIAIIAGVLCVAGGLTVLLAWHLDLFWLLRRHAADAPIVYNTGVAFVFTGVAVVAAVFGKRLVVAVGAAFDIVLAVAVLLQQLLDRSLGVDQLLFRTSVTGTGGVPGRVTPNIAVCLLVVGAALLDHVHRPTRRTALVTASAAGLVAATVGAAAAGYAAGSRGHYRLGRVTSMPAPAIGLFLVLASGLLALVWADLERSDTYAQAITSPSTTRGRRSMSVRRMVVLATLVTFLPLGLLAYTALTLGSRSVVNEARAGVGVSASMESETVLARMQSIQAVIRSIALRPGLITALGDGTAGTRSPAALQIQSDSAILVASGLTSVTVTDAEGVVLTTTPSASVLIGRDLSLEEWYLGASQTGDAFVSDAIGTVASDGPAVVAVAAPLRSTPSGVVIGYLMIGYSLTAIQEVAYEFEADTGLSLTVTDTHGAVLIAPFDTDASLPSAETEPVRRALAGEKGVVSRNTPNGSLITGFAPVESLGWAVLAEKPESAVLDAVAPLQAAVGGIALVLAAVLTIAIVLAAHTWRRQIQAERHLDSALVDLARSNAELEQFAYAASHDLSEPLRAISGPISLLARRYKGQLDAEADTFIGFAVEGCDRMQALIDGILALSRVGRLQGDIAPVDCNEVMNGVLRTLGPSIAETGATITVTRLPVVLADATQLAQVLQNLLANALKFVAAGVVPVVFVGAEREDHAWRLTVTDNGIGIDPRHRERIFGMFKRLHGRDEYPGTGIGLALVRKIIERHGGSVGVEDAPSGTGTRFWFTLPTER